MEVKLDSTSKLNSQLQTKKRSSLKRFFNFVQELKEEMQKVSWTTKEELRLSTKMVVIAMFICGLSIYIVDLGIKGVLDGIGVIFRSLFG